jgi:uncharacterized small protein (DUF1192 family)
MSEYVWETFDALFDTVERQGRIVTELEARIARMEAQLDKHEESEAA